MNMRPVGMVLNLFAPDYFPPRSSCSRSCRSGHFAPVFLFRKYLFSCYSDFSYPDFSLPDFSPLALVLVHESQRKGEEKS